MRWVATPAAVPRRRTAAPIFFFERCVRPLRGEQEEPSPPHPPGATTPAPWDRLWFGGDGTGEWGWGWEAPVTSAAAPAGTGGTAGKRDLKRVPGQPGIEAAAGRLEASVR